MKEVDFFKGGLTLDEETILSPDEIRQIAIEKWGDEIANRIPTYDYKVGTKIKLFINSKKFDKSKEDVLAFTRQNGLAYTGIHGLVQIKEADKKYNFLPIGTIIMARSYDVGPYHIPFIKKIGEGIFQHGTFSSEDDQAADDALAVYDME